MEGIILSEINQKDDKYWMISLTTTYSVCVGGWGATPREQTEINDDIYLTLD